MDSEAKEGSLSSTGSVSSNEDYKAQQHGHYEAINRGRPSEENPQNTGIKNTLALKREKRRTKIILEILDTEETYHRHLNLITKFLEEPLRKLKLIPDHVIVTIFSNIKQIININTELKQNLQVLPVGKAFLQIGPFLKLYSTYANNHERALATLMEWDQKRPEFSHFRRQQEEREEFAGLKLNALLITPVQRVPRYKLLLEDLLAHTDHQHEDYSSLKEACAQMGAVAHHINEHIRQQDNFMKMLAIQKSLAGQLAPKILTPGRMFIKDGPLKKVSKNGGRSHERMFFLFSDILLYGKPKLLESSGSSHSYSCCCILPLQHCSVSRVFGHSQGQASLFTVQCKDESLLLYSDQKTVESWMKALTSAISKFVENRQSLRKESSAKMPVRKGGLAKYMKQQDKSDPLKTGKKGAESPVNKSSPKTPKFLKRSLKDGGEGGASPSTPSPRKRQLQEALMRARHNVSCLTPRKSARSKKRRDKHSEEEGEIEGGKQVDPEVVSSPQVGEKLEGSQLEIGLDPSHIWKEGEDSTILEQSEVFITNDMEPKSCDETGASDYNPMQYRINYDDKRYPKDSSLAEDCRSDSLLTDCRNQRLQSDTSTYPDSQSLPGSDSVFIETSHMHNTTNRTEALSSESLPSSHSLESSYSRLSSRDREKVRHSQLSTETATSIYSVTSLDEGHRKLGRHHKASPLPSGNQIDTRSSKLVYTNSNNAHLLEDNILRTETRQIRPTSVSSSSLSSESDNSERMLLRDSDIGHTSSTGSRVSQSPSNVSDVSHSSFSTSLGELNEDSLRSITRHYSLLLERSAGRKYRKGVGGQQKMDSDSVISCSNSSGGRQVQYEDSSNNKRYEELEEYLSPIKRVHSSHNSRSSDKVKSEPFSSSPIANLKHSKKDNSRVHSKPKNHSPCKKDKSKTFPIVCEDVYDENCELGENVVPVKGWTTCYSRLQRLPGVQEEEGEASAEVERDTKGLGVESHGLYEESNKDSGLRWSEALEGVSQTAKAVYSSAPYPVTGQGCMVQ